LHNFAFNAGTFYLALYYQVRHFTYHTFNLAEAKKGCRWFHAVGSWHQLATLLSWIFFGIPAGCMVYRILAKKKSRYDGSEVGHLYWPGHFDIGFWFVLL
jgi:hypothetical protein